MKSLIYFFVAAFSFGIGVVLGGEFLVTPEPIIKTEIIHHWDFPSITEEELRIAAKFYGKTLEDTDKVVKLHHKNEETIKKLHRENKEEIKALHKSNRDGITQVYNQHKDEADKIKHRSWQTGYIEGFRNGREKQ